MTTHRLFNRMFLCLCFAGLTIAGFAQPVFELGTTAGGGPINGGLRLSLEINTQPTTDTFIVSVNLINVSTAPLTVHANWEQDKQTGDFGEYFKQAIGFDAYPPLEPWIGQAMMPRRALPQPTIALMPGQAVQARWTSTGRRLKENVIHPFETQNPLFLTPGLYSVHAVFRAFVNGKLFLLRSNEQHVPIGNRQDLPKFTHAPLYVNATDFTATLRLGNPQGVAVGDRFRFMPSMLKFWVLKVDKVSDASASGRIAQCDLWGRPRQGGVSELQRLPVHDATLIVEEYLPPVFDTGQ